MNYCPEEGHKRERELCTNGEKERDLGPTLSRMVRTDVLSRVRKSVTQARNRSYPATGDVCANEYLVSNLLDPLPSQAQRRIADSLSP